MVLQIANAACLSRRSFLQLGAAALTALPLGRAAGQEKPAGKDKPTQFQIACMTIPYAAFPVERALTGIKAAGYQYVAWGSSRREADGKRGPFLAAEAPPNQAKELGQRCRDLGLEPLLMFAGIYPEAQDH